MTGRTVLFLLVASLAVLASFGVAAADVCTGSWKETLTVGTIFSGTANNICYIDGSTEVLKEALDNGTSHLRVMWRFDNVPAGAQSINFYGTRVANTDGDNFQFYYNQDGGSTGTTISGALINKPFAPSGGSTIPLNLTTTQTSTIYILLWDTADGIGLDKVTLDRVAIVTQ